ncbi:helix-turn-helix transcriptional regulator [Leifsonia shinshuensis]|uniref:helix-turn-helix transcriptional regulator n=1 Tax=Leifsonia shinshuensis TaxID=150026 RepID=UPI0028627CD6|nr:helix-turn-helix transcriptional regulator [Leifsonia shinshuensis]MDR6972047.1 LuxR family maltose regulon positive regulatory protein [Leifsonia shinshuensis]
MDDETVHQDALDAERSAAGRAALAALQVAVDRSDGDGVTAAVRDGWFALASEQGDATRLLLERLPGHELRQHPLLAMMLGLTYNVLGFHRVRALRYFVTAVRAARAPRNQTVGPVDRVLIRSAEASAYRLIGRPGLSVGPARAAIAELDRLPEDLRETVSDLPRVYAQLGISLYYAGDVDGAMDTFAKGLAATPTTPPSPGFGNLAMLAGIHALQGDLPEARAHVDYARTGPWNDRQRRMYTGTFYRLAEAVLALERFDAAEAQAHLDAMEHDRRSIEHWVAEARVEALVRLVDGRPGEALAGLEAYAGMRSGEARSSAVRDQLSGIRAVLQLALGNPDAAGVILERDAAPGPERHIGRARVYLALGRNGSALSELKAASGRPLTARTATEAAALEAAVLLRLAPTSRTRGVVEQLGALLRRTGLRLPLALLPADDLERVGQALTAAGYGDVLQDVPLRSLLPVAEPDLLLTDRELAVLGALMNSGSTAEIASVLVVSANTVKTQLRSVYRKLGVNNREDAIAVALSRHLLVERD